MHTAVSQVFADPANKERFIAYYSVRHYKGNPSQASKFVVFGWYKYALEQGKISSLAIYVSAMEGDSAVLA